MTSAQESRQDLYARSESAVSSQCLPYMARELPSRDRQWLEQTSTSAPICLSPPNMRTSTVSLVTLVFAAVSAQAGRAPSSARADVGQAPQREHAHDRQDATMLEGDARREHDAEQEAHEISCANTDASTTGVVSSCVTIGEAPGGQYWFLRMKPYSFCKNDHLQVTSPSQRSAGTLCRAGPT